MCDKVIYFVAKKYTAENGGCISFLHSKKIKTYIVNNEFIFYWYGLDDVGNRMD